MLKPFDAILLNKAIHGGGTSVSGSISISANGTYDVSAFAEAIVNVSGGGDVIHKMLVGESISIYDLTTSVVSSAFVSAATLTEVELPNCTDIGASAFYGCTNITKLSLPKMVYLSRGYAFAYCKSLTEVYLPICERMDTSMFYACSSLSTINLPEVVNIGGNCFDHCDLQDVSVPKLASIGQYAFAACQNLSTLSLPKASAIYSSAFRSCYRLVSLYLMGSYVATLASTNVFGSSPISNYTNYTSGVNGSIFVPASLYNSYITANNWSVYSDRFVSVA